VWEEPIMDERRSFLKDLAARCSNDWSERKTADPFRGDARVETRNTIYQFKDGVCVSITRRDRPWTADPTVFIGMRIVGWLAFEDPRAGLIASWRPGAYAVLWRPRAEGEQHSSVALTSATNVYELKPGAPPVRRSVPPPLPPAARASSVPPPPPAKMPTKMMSLQTPPTMTRVNIPQPPETPTPPMSRPPRSAPTSAGRPPLPPRARPSAPATV
jgi:hypothetical protein